MVVAQIEVNRNHTIAITKDAQGYTSTLYRYDSNLRGYVKVNEYHHNEESKDHAIKTLRALAK